MRGRTVAGGPASSALACLVLAFAGCSSERVGVITSEGTVAPELSLAGHAWLSADRDSVFCKRNLLQMP